VESVRLAWPVWPSAVPPFMAGSISGSGRPSRRHYRRCT